MMERVTDDLITWLRAQLDEDEQVAHEALDLPPMVGEWRWARVSASSTRLVPCGRHHPARVLQDVEVKRRILSEHFEASLGDTGLGAGDCTTCMNYAWPCPTVRLLALPYADRPGYRQEWQPAT